MTSKISSHTHNPNDGEFDFVKGCCGKVRWNNVTPGGIWINGVFCEDEFLASSFNKSAITFHSHSEPCSGEHSEVDWISKEIAFQEFICNDKPSHWLDTSNARGECVKDEHDVDIISTLTAVAALFRDWCAVETDLSEQLVKDGREKSSTYNDGNQSDWIWFDDSAGKSINSTSLTSMPMKDAGSQWSGYDMAWEKLVHEYPEHERPQIPEVTQNELVVNGNIWLPDAMDTQLDTEWNRSVPAASPGTRQDCISHFHGDIIAGNGNACEQEEFGSQKFSVSDSVHDNSSETLDIDRYVMFGSQSPLTSRYSFGREGAGEFSIDKGKRAASISEEKEMEMFRFESGRLLVDDVNFCNNVQEEMMLHGEKTEGLPEALLYALPYMSLQDLLTMEGVSRSMRDSIKNDIILWQRLQIDPPINKDFTNEIFLQLSSRSKGQLQCLTLVECTRVTEDALEHVVALNPRITKLALPGCSRISADAVVRMVERLSTQKQSRKPGLKQLRVRNIYGLTVDHLRYLQSMIGVDTCFLSAPRKPQYYHNGHYASLCDDERPIDVEECPKCSNVRIVYDCTRDRCQQKQGNAHQECRACILCIVRCEECGRCINDNEYEETFSLDFLCSCCWLRLPKCTQCNSSRCGRHADHFMGTPEAMFASCTEFHDDK